MGFCFVPPTPLKICYPRGGTTIIDGLGLGQCWGSLGPSWHWLWEGGESFYELLAEASPERPPLPNPCHTTHTSIKRRRKKNLPPHHVTHFPENTAICMSLVFVIVIMHVTFSGEHYSIFWLHTKKSDSLSLRKCSYRN